MNMCKSRSVRFVDLKVVGEAHSTIEIGKWLQYRELKYGQLRVVELKTYFHLSKKGKVAKTLNLGNCQSVQGMQILYAGNTH